MWKRKLYVAAIGFALAHLSVAEFWDGGFSRGFGLPRLGADNCPNCGPPAQVNLPLRTDQLAHVMNDANLYRHDASLRTGQNLLGSTGLSNNNAGFTFKLKESAPQAAPVAEEQGVQAPKFQLGQQTRRSMWLKDGNVGAAQPTPDRVAASVPAEAAGNGAPQWRAPSFPAAAPVSAPLAVPGASLLDLPMN